MACDLFLFRKTFWKGVTVLEVSLCIVSISESSCCFGYLAKAKNIRTLMVTNCEFSPLEMGHS